MTTRIKLRRDTAANWTANNPILALGEAGIETDNNNIKYGDGITPWNDLDYPPAVKAREQAGFITEIGQQPSVYPFDDQWLSSVAVDADDNSYYIGGYYDDIDIGYNRNLVVKLNPLGGVEWQRRLTITEGDEGYGTSISVDPANGQLVTVNEFWIPAGSHAIYAPTIIRLDPATGDIVGHPTIISDAANIHDATPYGSSDYGDIYINAITTDNDGNTILAGTKYGDQKEIPVTPLLGSTGSVLIVSSSTFTAPEYPRYSGYDNAWYVKGTDLLNKTWINAVNRFDNVEGTSNSTTGTGATFDFYYNNKVAQVRSYNQGMYYQPGDVITIPADRINGLTSATITVHNVDGSGRILYRDWYYNQTDWSYTYAPDKSKVYLYVDDGDVAFESTGTWTVVHNYNSNAFVWSPDSGTPWNLSIGDSRYDQFDTVAVDSNNNIFAGGKGWTDTSTDGNEGVPEYYGSVVKISQAGQQLWAKSLEIVDGGEGWEVTGVTVDSNDDVIAVQSAFGDGLVTKIDNDGNPVWRKSFSDVNPMSMYDVSVTTDADDNIYVVATMNGALSLGDDLQILKIASDGHLVWQRSLGTWSDEKVSWYDPGKSLTVKNGMLYIAGVTYAGTNNIGTAIAIPTDGTGVGNFQSNNWIYRETNWSDWGAYTANSTMTNLVISSTATSLTVTTSTSYDSIDSDWPVNVTPVLHGFGGEVVGIKSLTFEDGSVQTSAAGTMNRSAEGVVWNEHTVVLRLEHAGQFLLYNNRRDNYNQYCDVYIPHNNDVAFPIGTEITFVKDERTQLIYFWPQYGNNEIHIVPAGLAPGYGYYNGDVFDGGEGWAVVGNPTNNHQSPGNGQWNTPGVIKLLKIDVNRWMLSTTPGQDIIQY
jgi:hypothetical protein